MTRATRQLSLALPFVVIYLLMLGNVIPVPLVSEKTATAILPVVSLRLCHDEPLVIADPPHRNALNLGEIPYRMLADNLLDPILAASHFRRVLTLIARSWPSTLPRLPRGLRESTGGDIAG
jgi:hypothetical protein